MNFLWKVTSHLELICFPGGAIIAGCTLSEGTVVYIGMSDGLLVVGFVFSIKAGFTLINGDGINVVTMLDRKMLVELKLAIRGKFLGKERKRKGRHSLWNS